MCRFTNMLTFVVILPTTIRDANTALVGLSVRSVPSFLVTASCYTLAWTDFIPWWSKKSSNKVTTRGLCPEIGKKQKKQMVHVSYLSMCFLFLCFRDRNPKSVFLVSLFRKQLMKSCVSFFLFRNRHRKAWSSCSETNVSLISASGQNKSELFIEFYKKHQQQRSRTFGLWLEDNLVDDTLYSFEKLFGFLAITRLFSISDSFGQNIITDDS